MVINAVIAEDNKTYRSILRKVLSRSDHQVKVVGEAEDGVAAVELIQRHGPDLLLLDIHMPLMNGFTVLDKVRPCHPHIKILILTMNRDPGYVRQALKKGADGYCTKDANYKEILRAIDTILKGKSYIGSAIRD
jgi:DNA-binding NarL/FixJ family response regulator